MLRDLLPFISRLAALRLGVLVVVLTGFLERLDFATDGRFIPALTDSLNQRHYLGEWLPQANLSLNIEPTFHWFAADGRRFNLIRRWRGGQRYWYVRGLVAGEWCYRYVGSVVDVEKLQLLANDFDSVSVWPQSCVGDVALTGCREGV